MADEPSWNLNFLGDNLKCRFIDVSKDDVDKLIAQQKNENTKRKTLYDLNIVLKYLLEVERQIIIGNLTRGADPISQCSLLQLQRRKVNNMSRPLSEEA